SREPRASVPSARPRLAAKQPTWIRKRIPLVRVKVPAPVAADLTRLTDHDLYLFNEGSHFRLFDKLGAHPMAAAGVDGPYFAVWAPSARHVTVFGSFNDWHMASHPLRPRGQSGIWEGFVPGVGRGASYKFHVTSHHGYRVDKADPFAFFSETPPATG